jgi:hypothetical protein
MDFIVKIKNILHKYLFCYFLNRAPQNIIPVNYCVTDKLPQNMSKNRSSDFQVYNIDTPDNNSYRVKNTEINHLSGFLSSQIDTPVSSFRIFTNSLVRPNSQCDLCRETSALTHSKIYCEHEPNINLYSGLLRSGCPCYAVASNQERDTPHSGLRPRIEVKKNVDNNENNENNDNDNNDVIYF